MYIEHFAERMFSFRKHVLTRRVGLQRKSKTRIEFLIPHLHKYDGNHVQAVNERQRLPYARILKHTNLKPSG